MKKHLIKSSIFSLVGFFFATAAHVDDEKEIKTALVRLYCFYVPEAKKKAPEEEQIASQTYVKLMHDVNGKPESLKIDAHDHQTFFKVPEAQYYELTTLCQNFVQKKGELLNIKATRASQWESVSRFHNVVMDVSPNDDSGVIALSDEQIREELGIDLATQTTLADAIHENTDAIKRIAYGLSHPSLAKVANLIGASAQNTFSKIKDISTHELTTTTLTVAAIIAAAWFGPAYVATAVDLLYPMVYGALWGVPSKWGLTYWLVYHPSKVHAVAWAYNHAGPIISISGLILASLQKGYSRFRDRSVREHLTTLKHDLKGALGNMAEVIERDYAKDFNEQPSTIPEQELTAGSSIKSQQQDLAEGKQ